MLIKGTDYGFCLTTEAGIKLAKISPDENITLFAKLLDGTDYKKAAENLAEIADILNEGYVNKEAYDHGREAPRIEKDQMLGILMHSTLFEYNRINSEIVNTVIRDMVGEVEAVEKPGKKGKKEATGAGA